MGVKSESCSLCEIISMISELLSLISGTRGWLLSQACTSLMSLHCKGPQELTSDLLVRETPHSKLDKYSVTQIIADTKSSELSKTCDCVKTCISSEPKFG